MKQTQRKLIASIMKTTLTILASILLFFTACTKDENECTGVPDLKQISISTEEKEYAEFELKLLAAAEAEKKILTKQDVLATGESQLENILEKSKSTETKVSQQFYEWYKKARLEICSLMAMIREAKEDPEPDYEFIRNTRKKLVDLILAFGESNPLPDIPPIISDLVPPIPKFTVEEINKINDFMAEMGRNHQTLLNQDGLLGNDAIARELDTCTKLHALGLTYFRMEVTHMDFSPKDLNKLINATRINQNKYLNCIK